MISAKIYKANKRKVALTFAGTTVFLLTLFYFSLPSPLFNTPTSTVIESRKGELLSARIADDGQWRFPLCDSVPQKFKSAITTFEDKNFYSHFGTDFLATGAALYQNIKAGEIVRGASTLTMQVIRLSKNNPERTIWEKVKEVFLAWRLETASSKEEILRLYASHAPFGGNVVGLDAASWRYFSRPAWKLSWAETCMLAVLPNAPSLVYPGKNQILLKEKRDRLLKKLYEQKVLDSLSYALAIEEPITGTPAPIPMHAPHLLNFAEKSGSEGQRVKSTVDLHLQKRVNNILEFHFDRLSGNEIYNAAALVLEVETGEVKAYGGNIPGHPAENKGYNVDVIQAPRSTGSILKPMLFSMLINDAKYLPSSLVADIPTILGGYAPKNYDLSYDGAVSLKQAIARSLNVPAVRLLHEYGIEQFHANLKSWGMSTLTNPASHYGLSIILGGSEGTLWDMATIYRNMAWKLNHYHLKKTGNSNQLTEVKWSLNKESNSVSSKNYPSPGSIWHTFEAMNEVARPQEDQAWREYSSSYKIAWKTGTSFGHRDGWAIGCTPKYVVAVWAGNASGEGRPGLTGVDAAAPIMFDIFRQLKNSSWFLQPFNDMEKAAICLKSGYKAGEACEAIDTNWVQKAGVNTTVCPYHSYIFLTKDEKYRVNNNCESISKMVKKKWFTLPPAMEYFYKTKNPSYQLLPQYRPDCQNVSDKETSFAIIYPVKNSRIYVPRELDGNPGKTVFEVASARTGTVLFWYLDNSFLGQTESFHQMGLNPAPGKHKLTVVDQKGESKEVTFEIISAYTSSE